MKDSSDEPALTLAVLATIQKALIDLERTAYDTDNKGSGNEVRLVFTADDAGCL